MCVVGDLPFDQPYDLEQLLFINDRSMQGNMANSGEVIAKIILRLLKDGRGSFINGFESIFRKSEKELVTLDRIFVRRKSWTVETHQAKALIDDGGIQFQMFYRKIKSLDLKGIIDVAFPVITNIEAPKYRRPLVRVI
jgi:hypothetical protein